MIDNLPIWIELLFLASFGLTVAFFFFSNGKPLKLTTFILVWSLAQSILAYLGFYQETQAFPPRFGLVILPSIVFVVYGLLPKQQKWIAEKRDSLISTLLHSIRIPVEIVLFGLFNHQMVPKLMTFEGRNFDILIGLSAPIMGWLFFKKKVNKSMMLAWNIIGLCFVLFILVNGILSAELPFQQFGFEQPNRAVNYFPFVLLPATIVPIVIWTHLSDIIQLGRKF
ncbi:hypothetical protein SAMN04488519_103269 [Algoriphagus ornithinivorans]|uniref:Uncharacterized protein n=1 Tax=Algoriphagus ornithinivorans TaxID=226506 RepID=A0A1I5E3D2_9BACT|nr:hypothetical protein [Algoriphagus ornithinivorans]SFO05936.1 hypothetical protein SAMN04488519_103269 [Algoriphagus ornithinivorans]